MVINKNRLQYETSPYLLQHASNPVDWYPWGQEAFDRAEKENKAIFVSIGYSTCHWCHRMAHDCFEDQEVAALLNANFINIKVDREERPDIDQLYLNVCQMLTGSGGWPLHVFLTPQQLPFYAGTYFPKYSVGQQPGMLDLIAYIAKVYKEENSRVQQIGQSLQKGLVKQSFSIPVMISPTIAEDAYKTLFNHFDGLYGGFGTAPKFPSVSQLLFLMKYSKLYDDQQALFLVEKTLTHLYRGGIYDHLGGGFSRYSVDQQWLVPHFEKMLYDQALMIIAYSEVYQLTKNPLYKMIIAETIDFLIAEMQDEDGSFYAAIDADSEGKEGEYYTWRQDELPADFAAAFGAQDAPHLDGKYVLNLIENDNFPQMAKQFEVQRKQLLALRQKRHYPHVDKKKLSGWNALVVVAFSKAAQATQDDQYKDLAIQLMQILETRHMNEGKLYSTNESNREAFLDDYSYLLWAYNELALLTTDDYYVKQAKKLFNYINANFGDRDNGGYLLSSSNHEQLIVNQRSILDGALPPGNAIMAVEGYRLAKIIGNQKFEQKALQQLTVFSKDIMNYPSSTLSLLQVELLEQAQGAEIHIIAQDMDFLRAVQQQYRPFDSWTYTNGAPFSVQICSKQTCYLAMKSPKEANEWLEKVSKQ
ncbi:thioredoxin domain-containing protein [Kurthia sibirica]|uniref:Spermatogenesis-associated protein 20-like TRX domain-containing protein n=1 Tax=Kurthia sibirica TaxID=202750 RepID=A0A2U3ALR5_9BACL|nr:thioredoxin domain-containing protein [Kurthia sibirica]PWI25449.1 hypothetical protein DEX24_07530 [Kurthia sibirica]GEK34971.1 hypothetical protein KSI01_25040 [Kurthia sibirica]